MSESQQQPGDLVKVISKKDDIYLRSVFSHFDTDGSGALDKKEVRKLLVVITRDMGRPMMSPPAFNQFFRDLDRDHNRQVDYSEFKASLASWFVEVRESRRGELVFDPAKAKEALVAVQD